MPELYPGQTETVRAKLLEAELLLQSNQETLRATDDPDKRASLLRLIAGQSGTIGAYRRQLQRCEADADTERSEVYKIRFTPDERSRYEARAVAAGQTLAQWIRDRCET